MLKASVGLSPVIVAAFASFAYAGSSSARYDGTWDAEVSCQNAAGALGYSFKFPSQVTSGVLHGEKGERDQPGWYQIDGKIEEDGRAVLDANGLVGAAAVAVGRRPKGTAYAYHVRANFTETSGVGDRVEGRPCHAAFARSK